MKKLIFILFTLSLSWYSSFTQAEEAPIFTDAELAQMLAPVALYPDSVLTHILIASTYPIEVIQADRWIKEHPDVKSSEAIDLVDDKSWDPNVKALIAFPSLLARMSDEVDWTQKLGDAFLQDEERVLDSIQNLRQKADEAGSLSKMEHMEANKVESKIVIQSVQPEVIYVPVYDTRVVYGSWYWMDYPPVYWHSYYPSYSGLYYWEPGIHIGFNFFFSAFHWHDRRIVVSDYHPHHYNHRGYYGGSRVIHDHSARRWEHNPRHRRGVAYRTEYMRERYNSARPSVERQRVIRQQEQHVTNNPHAVSGHERGTTIRETRDSQLNQRLNRMSQSRENNRENNRSVNRANRDSQTNSTRVERNRTEGKNQRSVIKPIRSTIKPDVIRPETRTHEPQPSTDTRSPPSRIIETPIENSDQSRRTTRSSSDDKEPRQSSRSHERRSSQHSYPSRNSEKRGKRDQ